MKIEMDQHLISLVFLGGMRKLMVKAKVLVVYHIPKSSKSQEDQSCRGRSQLRNIAHLDVEIQES